MTTFFDVVLVAFGFAIILVAGFFAGFFFGATRAVVFLAGFLVTSTLLTVGVRFAANFEPEMAGLVTFFMLVTFGAFFVMELRVLETE